MGAALTRPFPAGARTLDRIARAPAYIQPENATFAGTGHAFALDRAVDTRSRIPRPCPRAQRAPNLGRRRADGRHDGRRNRGRLAVWIDGAACRWLAYGRPMPRRWGSRPSPTCSPGG